MQYENLTAPATHGAVLADLQRWLGMDPSLGPPSLPRENSRKAQSQGWPMARQEYSALVGKAREQSVRRVPERGLGGQLQQLGGAVGG